MEDPSTRTSGVAEPDARGCGAGVVRVAAGSLRDPSADARGGGGDRDRPATALVHRDVEDPAMSPARVSSKPPGSAAVVSELGGGDRGGSTGGASGPDQPPRHQAEDEQLEEEEARASQVSSAPQGI